MFAVAWYTLLFIVALIPTGAYCHWREQRDTDQNNH